jgi:hypothetical protein
MKEAEAVVIVMRECVELLENKRGDLYVDKLGSMAVWGKETVKEPEMNDIRKNLFQLCTSSNIDFNMKLEPLVKDKSGSTPQTIHAEDISLCEKTWEVVERMYGPHSIDLMARDEHAMVQGGKALKHYTPQSSQGSAGVNIFAQDITMENNPYVFPPEHLIFPVLKLLEEQKVGHCTIILEEPEVVPQWGPYLGKRVVSKIL